MSHMAVRFLCIFVCSKSKNIIIRIVMHRFVKQQEQSG